jgi:hypothetical protein
MLKQSTTNVSCKDSEKFASLTSTLTRFASTAFSTSTLVKLAAASLVVASAGFGAYYAGGLGAEQGTLLAVLSVAMALGLELAKPFGIAAAFDAFRNYRIAQGIAVALLGLVAVSYSLSAELSLWSSMRSDRIAERAATSNIAVNARERHQRAILELDGQSAARTTDELQSLIDNVLADPRAGGCVAMDGPYTRQHCPQVAEWKSEQARGQRREQLQQTIRETEVVMASGPVAKAADPGATALATYLAFFGLKVEPSLLTELLILVGVVALELGSALGLVLVQSVSGQLAREEVKTAASVKVSAPVETPAAPANPVSATKVKKRRKRTRKNDQNGRGGSGSGGQRMPANVVDLLRAKGGRIEGGQRGIGKLLGVGKSRAHEILHELAAAGAVILNTSMAGTTVQLAAA